MSLRRSCHAPLRAVTIALVAGSLGACAGPGSVLSLDEVKPWERDVLAHEDMQLVTDTMDATIDDHIYFSREASTGGGGAKGGGCGCN